MIARNALLNLGGHAAPLLAAVFFVPPLVMRLGVERFGFLAIGIPAILPPPLPFKIFVATAGALEYPRWKFLLTVMIARSFRYYVEGILAVFYGQRVLLFLKDNGLVILSVVGSLALIGATVYFIVSRRRRGTIHTVEELEETPAAERTAD